MGCVSSKMFRKDLKRDILFGNGEDYPNHVVCLTSTTYGALKLDKENKNFPPEVKECVIEVKKSSPTRTRQEPEIINAWELMEGLEEEVSGPIQSTKKSPKSRGLLRDMDPRSPLKFLNNVGSPRKFKRIMGKENIVDKPNVMINGRSDHSPGLILKTYSLPNSCKRVSPKWGISRKWSPGDPKCGSFRVDSGVVLSRKKSLGPLFDPVAEKEIPEIKKIVPKCKTSKELESILLESYEKKCPPGGENAVVIYTTTLRGIRKTYEECNAARSAIESHQVQMFERDISMHSGFKEELRKLMGKTEVKVPMVFIKGRLIGGADEMVKLEEEGKLDILLQGIPTALATCEGCGGVRFVMCKKCNGSCKVLDKDGKKKTVKCDVCNENGLIQCPICCC